MALSILLYTIFSAFAYIHNRQASSYKGESVAMGTALDVSSSMAVLTGAAYFLWYGSQVSWMWAAVIILVGAVASGLLAGLISFVPLAPQAAFAIWPAAAVAMFLQVPKIVT